MGPNSPKKPMFKLVDNLEEFVLKKGWDIQTLQKKYSFNKEFENQ